MLSFKKAKCETCFNAGKPLTLNSYTASCTWPDERVPESRCKVSIRSSKMLTRTMTSCQNLMTIYNPKAPWKRPNSRQSFPYSIKSMWHHGHISFKFESATMKRVYTMDPCVIRRRLMLFSILCQMKLAASFITAKVQIPPRSFYPLFLRMSRKQHMESRLAHQLRQQRQWGLHWFAKNARSQDFCMPRPR